MTDCCEDSKGSPLERLPAGLRTLPRQLRGFPEIRQALLAGIAGRPALSAWSPASGDLGLMWLEMWAYIGDVLGFYDARIADESYVRTAVQRRALRRSVALLGYSPRGGLGGSAKLAALARGSELAVVPAGTAFRSRGFGEESPQVFESAGEVTVDPAKNRWTVQRFKRALTLDGATGVGVTTDSLLFESGRFALAKGQLALFDDATGQESEPVSPAAAVVTAVESTDGGDGKNYMRVTFAPALTIVGGFDLRRLRVRTPVQSAVATVHLPVVKTQGKNSTTADNPDAGEVFFDGGGERFRKGERMISEKQHPTTPQLAAATIARVAPAFVRMDMPIGDPPLLPATSVELSPTSAANLSVDQSELTFHFDFVDAGSVTLSAKAHVSAAELVEGVPVGTLDELPRELAASAQASIGDLLGVLTQPFLLADAKGQAACVDGELLVLRDRSATFRVVDTTQLPSSTLELPLTIYGNLVDVTRGQSVLGEVLGHGDARQVNQRFRLKKKPLTTVYDIGAGGAVTSLEIWVDGVRWREVPSFFGCGPQDLVYAVIHDDEQNATVTFGDGVLGARLPSGVKNVMANYRFGAGEAAPPSGAITQLAGAVKGLRGVASPLAPSPGKDPEPAEELRQLAPRRALLLGRIVSAADFAAVASDAPGVVRATAQWSWLEAQMQAGVGVHYIGSAPEGDLVGVLRAQADPTVPLSVTQASAIAVDLHITLESHPTRAPSVVASAAQASLVDEEVGLLATRNATIGGTFWPSQLFEALLRIDGVVAVSGITLATAMPGFQLSAAESTCIPDGHYLDFVAAGSVVVTAVPADKVVASNGSEQGK